jgi:hypothetical protein
MVYKNDLKNKKIKELLSDIKKILANYNTEIDNLNSKQSKLINAEIKKIENAKIEKIRQTLSK